MAHDVTVFERQPTLLRWHRMPSIRGRAALFFALAASCAHVVPEAEVQPAASPIPCALSVDGQPDEHAQCLVSVRAHVAPPAVPAQDAGLLGVLGKVRVRTLAQLARRRCKLDYRGCVSEASRTFDSPCPTLACTRAAERIYTTDIARCDRVLQSCVAPWPTVCLYRMASGGCAFDDSTWDLDE